MTTTDIRRKLHDYIADANDNKIQGMYLLLEDDINRQTKFKLLLEQIEILEEERKSHLKGKSQTYTWDEVKQFVRRNKAEN